MSLCRWMVKVYSGPCLPLSSSWFIASLAFCVQVSDESTSLTSLTSLFLVGACPTASDLPGSKHDQVSAQTALRGFDRGQSRG
jgi:hypothetical protein